MPVPATRSRHSQPQFEPGEAPPTPSGPTLSPYDDMLATREWWKERKAFWQGKLEEAARGNDIEAAAKAAHKIEYCEMMRFEVNKALAPYVHRKLAGEKPLDQDANKGPATALITQAEGAL